MNLQAIIQWIAVLERVQAAGGKGWAEIKAAIAAQGFEADTAAIDAALEDVARRKAIAAREAGADS